nr:M56 family metallopeptidase [Actinomycetota bacterium]
MNLAVCLLAYSMVVTVLGPPLLAAMIRDGAAPRLGVTVWLAAMASVLAAWVGAAGLFVAQLVDSWDHLGRVLTGCLAGLRLIAVGGYGSALQAFLLVLAALSVAALAVAGARTALAVRGSRRSTNAHAQAARLAAVTTPPGPEGALVLDSAQPAVYCLAGRPHTIVITRAALEALDDAQLAAVLAHEQAHLRGRHHHPLAITAALAKVLPGVRLFTDGAADIARLLEMCADDAAARRHDRDTLVDALLALALP